MNKELSIKVPLMVKDCFGHWVVYFFDDRFNNLDCNVFSLKEEAEAKLKELRGEK